MHWLKYIPCKISIQQDLTFCALFVSLSSRSVYEDGFFVNFAENFVPLLLVPTAIFLRSLCNVFLRTETRPVREKQIDRTVEGEETRQKAKATKKSWSLIITWWKHKYWKGEYGEWFTMWRKGRILRTLGIYLDIIWYRKVVKF